MEFAHGENEESFRSAVRAFFDLEFPARLRGQQFERPHDAGFYKKLALWKQENLAGRRAFEVSVFYEEAAAAGISLINYGPTEMVTSTIAQVGSEAQKRGVLRGLREGDFLVCLGFTEPDSGSDVAAARTRAVRDGDEWVINGQKIFTSNAQHASHVFLLTRTNLDVPKHQGLTVFLIPLDSPGIEVRPLYTLAYHHTNITSYTDVRVPDECRVGEVDGGWQVMKVALTGEQAGASNGDLQEMLARTVAWARDEPSLQYGKKIDDPTIRERLAHVAIEHEICKLLGSRSVWAAEKGLTKNPGWGPGSKLFQSEAYVRASADLFAMAGPAAVLPYEEEGSVAGGWINYSFRDAPVRILGGGSSEVMRDIIAERRLGLPRARPRADST